MTVNLRVVLTGAPGGGKTALLQALARRGHSFMPDSARAIIRGRRQLGLPPRPSPVQFAREILAMDVEQHLRSATLQCPVFFERGIVDAVGMLHDAVGLSAAEISRYVTDYPYFPRVFLLPPWEEIYETDAERDQTFAESVRAHDGARRWYLQCGYQIVDVPRLDIDARCAFVLKGTRTSN